MNKQFAATALCSFLLAAPLMFVGTNPGLSQHRTTPSLDVATLDQVKNLFHQLTDRFIRY